jgi:hypothetical protein
MNNFRKLISFVSLATLILASAFAVHAQIQAKAGNDEFFVISSIDKTHNALVLLRPTQITATIGVNDKTKFADENGKSIKITDLRTGDTIFVTYSTQNNTLVAQTVRKGMMTTAEMRKRYLPGLPITTSPKGLGH